MAWLVERQARDAVDLSWSDDVDFADHLIVGIAGEMGFRRCARLRTR